MEKLKVYLCYSSAILCVFLFGALLYTAFGGSHEPIQTAAKPSSVIIIDAGHGGEDSGAVANGVIEKDVNLDIALKLRDFLVSSGYTVVMTRDSDISIYDSSAATVREKKVSDLHNRLSIINGSEDNILISIHQNKFEQSKYYGAQMFYSKNNTESQVLAESVRQSVTGLLQPENKRELKAADKTIYILNKATVPAVIVECGFLSNPDEAQKLSDENYRKKMAFAIYCGFLNYQKQKN
ncbi:MAG: N-acetylmuramoyl-L-alanine amidase CwlD [Clostridia bacterium]|nr:N-acetylmuramoyl-L-alanine amidase CwlD [Clostridia bacterium]